MTRNLLILGLIAVLVAGFAAAYLLLTPADKRGSMGMGEATDAPDLPAVLGYAEGEEIAFVHTETSAPEVAAMMAFVVPALAEAPLRLRQRDRGGRAAGFSSRRRRPPARERRVPPAARPQPRHLGR